MELMISMKLVYKINWNKGILSVEAESIDELESLIEKLKIEDDPKPPIKNTDDEELPNNTDMPTISGKVGVTEAIKKALNSPWGKKAPRNMTELKNILQTNALFFSDGSISSILYKLVKSGKARRLKINNQWAYVILE